MCEVRSKEKRARNKKKSTMVSSKKKWTVMNPIRRRMKKRNPSSGQNGQLVHWWLLIHSGRAVMGARSRLRKLHHCHNLNTEKEKAMF
jgi:hypothetical protein